MSVMKDLKLHLMISNHFIWNWKLQFMTPHCIDQIRNTAFQIGEIFCCLGARPLQIQPRHHPPNSSEEGEWINWDCFFFTCFFFQSARLTTGPEIRGCRPILVTFHNFKVGNPLLFDSPFSQVVLTFVIDCQRLSTFFALKDREDVLSKARLLKRSNIYVSEDLSRYFFWWRKFWSVLMNENQEDTRAPSWVAEILTTGLSLHTGSVKDFTIWRISK